MGKDINIWEVSYSQKQLALIAEVAAGCLKLKDTRVENFSEELFDVFENHENTTPVYRKIKGSLVKDLYAATVSNSSGTEELKNNIQKLLQDNSIVANPIEEKHIKETAVWVR